MRRLFIWFPLFLLILSPALPGQLLLDDLGFLSRLDQKFHNYKSDFTRLSTNCEEMELIVTMSFAINAKNWRTRIDHIADLLQIFKIVSGGPEKMRVAELTSSEINRALEEIDRSIRFTRAGLAATGNGKIIATANFFIDDLADLKIKFEQINITLKKAMVPEWNFQQE